MPKLSLSTIGIIVVLVAVVGGVYLYSTGDLSQLGQEQQEGESESQQLGQEQQKREIDQPAVRSIAGKVTSIEIAENSFVIFQAADERSFTVRLGENTNFIRLIFPFDIANPPPGVSFTPIREEVSIEDLKVGEQVFVRSSVPVKSGDEVVDPLEVQILP